MKKIFSLIFGASLLLSAGLGNASIAAREGSSCTNATIKGNFGSQLSGSYGLGKAGQSGLLAEVGLFQFDGMGNLNATDTGSLNGRIISSGLVGTYNVKENCTITLTFTDDFNNPSVNLSGTIVNNGKEILVIETDQGTATTGILKKVGI